MEKVKILRDQHSHRAEIKEIHGDYLVCLITLPEGRKLVTDVAKPYALRSSPFNGQTINYPEVGKSNATQQVAYAYTDGTNYNKRVATYSNASERCDSGDHVETIFPPYEVGNSIIV